MKNCKNYMCMKSDKCTYMKDNRIEDCHFIKEFPQMTEENELRISKYLCMYCKVKIAFPGTICSDCQKNDPRYKKLLEKINMSCIPKANYSHLIKMLGDVFGDYCELRSEGGLHNLLKEIIKRLP